MKKLLKKWPARHQHAKDIIMDTFHSNTPQEPPPLSANLSKPAKPVIKSPPVPILDPLQMPCPLRFTPPLSTTHSTQAFAGLPPDFWPILAKMKQDIHCQELSSVRKSPEYHALFQKSKLTRL